MGRLRLIDREIDYLLPPSVIDYLLPPSVQDWLPEAHLDRHVVEAEREPAPPDRVREQLRVHEEIVHATIEIHRCTA